MTDYGIRAVGAYAPRARVSAEAFREAWGRFEAAGVESKAVPDADEDALTMAVEASRRALDAGDAAAGDVEYLALATTNPPLEETDLTVTLGSFLGVDDAAVRRTHTGSTRAGLEALSAAIDAAPATGLVVASDCPAAPPDDDREHAAGAGAAAFLVGPDAPCTIVERVEHVDPYPGTRFRERGAAAVDGLDIGRYDRHAFVEPIATALDGLEVTEADAVALQAPDGKRPYRLTGTAGIDAEAIQACETVSTLGDTGAASVPLSLACAFAAAADRTIAVAWGAGVGATAMRLSGTPPTTVALDGGEELDYAGYLRRRDVLTGDLPDGGAAHIPVPTYRRSLLQRHRHVAGRCPSCGAVAFPPEGACPGCNELVTYQPVELPREGTVETATRIGQGGAPPEFAAQQRRAGEFGVAVVRFEADGAVSLPMQVRGTVARGDRIEAIPRLIYEEEGVPRYGLKARPL